MGFQIKYFVKNAVTQAAFEGRTFYGANSTGQIYPEGYPNAACTMAGDVDISAYEITAIVDSTTGATINGDPTPTTSVVMGSSILDSTYVGAYMFDYTNPQEPVFVCVVSSITNGTTFVADRTFSADFTYTDIAFQKVGAANFTGFKANESFYVAIETIDPTEDVSVFPQIKGITTGYSSLTRTGTNNPSYLGLSRVSALGVPGTSASPVAVTCTVKRVNTFLGGNTANTYFKTNEDKPFWTVDEVNPYGTASTSLSKYTLYKAFCTEALATTNVAINFTYSSAESGWI